jgi:hypothetical protein
MLPVCPCFRDGLTLTFGRGQVKLDGGLVVRMKPANLVAEPPQYDLKDKYSKAPSSASLVQTSPHVLAASALVAKQVTGLITFTP